MEIIRGKESINIRILLNHRKRKGKKERFHGKRIDRNKKIMVKRLSFYGYSVFLSIVKNVK